MTRLSHLEGERDLQKYVIAFLGWFVVAVLAVGGAGVVVGLAEPGEGPGEWVPVRAAMGAVASVVSLRLPWLVRRHVDGIGRIRRLKGQYLTAALLTAVLPVPAAAFYWWAGLPATVVGLVSVVLVARVRRVPVEEMTETIDHREPEAWAGRSLLGDRFVFLKAIGLGLALGLVLVGGVLLLGT